MAAITIQKFGGLVPRESPRLIANGDATVSVMNKVWSDELRPILDFARLWEVPLPPLTEGVVLTLYLFLDKWLAWFSDVNVVTGFNTLGGSGRIYWTGQGIPRQAFYNDLRYGPAVPLVSSTYPIGIVGPTNPPTVSLVGSGPDPVVKSYVYTFYDFLNQESVPSPPSALITVGTGDSVIVSGFDAAPPNTTEIRIYRTVGAIGGFEGTFVFVASIAPVVTSYTDSATDLDLAGNEQLQSQEYYPPPVDPVTGETLKGLISLACGSLAAFRGNSVFFSEPYQPGAWPPAYEKIFDYPVVALGTFGQTCVVATTGYTYLISGNDPRSFSVARVPDPYPCVSKRSMVSADNGVVYASADGLIFVGNSSYVSAYSGVHVITRELMTYDEWQAYNPTTIHGIIFDGRYYGFYINRIIVPGQPIGGGFVFDFSNRINAMITGVVQDSGSAPDRKDILSDLNFYATASFANPQVSLHFSKETLLEPPEVNPPLLYNVLYKWEGGNTYLPLTWRSKQFSLPYAAVWSVGKIIFNTAFPIEEPTFRLLDGATGAVLYERVVESATPFRLPSLSGRTEWAVEVEGVAAFQLIQIASSYQDLNQRQAVQ